MAITSFAQLTQFMGNILSENGQAADSQNAPHGAFWSTLTYDQFVNGNAPNIDPPAKILVVGNSAQSNLILALRGSGKLFDPNTGSYGQMPADGPPFFTDDQINQIAGWIDAGCPQ
jgi:hypothetical protein